MKKFTSIQTLGMIFLFSVAVELVSMSLTGFSGKSILRLIFLSGLMILLLKGYSFARYILGAIYAFSGILMSLMLIRSIPNLEYSLFCFITAMASFGAAMFFFKSKLLRALTDKKAEQIGPSEA